MDLDIAVKTSLHLERPMPEDCITALDELNELALSPLMLKKQPDVVTTIRYVIIIIGSFRSSGSHKVCHVSLGRFSGSQAIVKSSLHISQPQFYVLIEQ